MFFEVLGTTGSHITITLDLVKLQRALSDASSEAQAALLEEVRGLENRMTARARELAGTLRQVRTGAYERSFESAGMQSARQVMARIYSGNSIAAALERGAKLPPHEIKPDRAKALHFFAAGDVFAMHAHFPGAEIKGKPVLGQTLEEFRNEIFERLTDAINRAVEKLEGN